MVFATAHRLRAMHLSPRFILQFPLALLRCFRFMVADHRSLSTFVQVNSGQHGNEYEGNDLNVEEAWLQGLTGCNVTVAVVDDGIHICYMIFQNH